MPFHYPAQTRAKLVELYVANNRNADAALEA